MKQATQARNDEMRATKTSKPKRTKAVSAALASADLAAPTAECKETPALSEKRPAVEKLTEVKARMDVGWGNTLFIRGQGEGLSWDKGSPLACMDNSTWIWSTQHAGTNIIFKLLLNDRVWSEGADTVVQPGESLEVIPNFSPPAG